MAGTDPTPLPEKEVYGYLVTTQDGQEYPQYNYDGTENKFPDINTESVSSFVFVPRIGSVPTHCLAFTNGLKFIRRFGRGFLRQGKSEKYVQCVVTNLFRMWLSADGRVLITEKDYELERPL